MESLSSYARQFLNQMPKPDVDEITGLSPAISIDQKSASRNPRSTVATVTEIYDYLRVLYARTGRPHCPVCGKPIQKLTPEQIVDAIMKRGEPWQRTIQLGIWGASAVESVDSLARQVFDLLVEQMNQAAIAAQLHLSKSKVLELMAQLKRIVESMAQASRESGVPIVTGDTKVVEKGKGDGVFISTTGLGVLPEGRNIGGAQARVGDVILLSGSIGEHGVAVLSQRESLEFETTVASDTAALHTLVAAMLGAAPGAVIGAGAGSFAAPMALREALMTAYSQDQARSWGDVWEIGRAHV